MDSISQYHHLMWHHSASAEDLFSCRTAASIAVKPETYIHKILRGSLLTVLSETCHAATDSRQCHWYLSNKFTDGFLMKARNYLTTHWLAGYNLTLGMHCYEGMSNEAHKGRHLTTTLELFRNHRTSTDSPNTAKKIVRVFSFSNCNHQWLKWPNLNH